MAAELVGGAIVGAVFGELLKLVIDAVKKTTGFTSELKHFEESLRTMEPVINEIKKSSEELDILEDYTKELIGYLNDGKELVTNCSHINKYDFKSKHHHTRKLIHLNKDLLTFFQTKTPANLMSTSLTILNELRALTEKVSHLLSTATSRAVGISGSCSVPGLPEFTIGLDQRLGDVKPMLLKDTTRLFLVSGPGGFGKSTLVEKLGHDPEIKGIFGADILYVTVSTDNSLKSIAKTLFQHYDINNFDFKGEKDAKNQIENLIRQKGSGKMFLLILDDVWPESESVIRDLRFQIPGYKILVTSRSLLSGFDSTYNLKELNAKDANTLFRHCAFPSDKDSVHNVPNDLVDKIVDFCKGIPLALITVGSSLRGKPVVIWLSTLSKWSQGQSILESHERLLVCLQTSVDALDESHKDCFLDLGLFPKDDQIVGAALMDMWIEFYELDEDGMVASHILHELQSRNLINLVPNRKSYGETEGHCNWYRVAQHDVLKELSVHLGRQDPEAKQKRFIEIHSNTFPEWWTRQTVDARILSITTDEEFESGWKDLNAPNVEVLILNIRSASYSLPQFIKKMSQLKVLIVTGYNDYPTQLDNLQVLASLSKLSRIRFEHVSVSSSVQVIFTMKTLEKLTFVMCKFGNALAKSSTAYPYMHLILKSFKKLTSYMFKIGNDSAAAYPFTLENLKHLEFDLCYDLKELPAGLCGCASLQKLIIINCQELHSLPKELGNLSDLEILRLHCCTKLKELQESIGSLGKLYSIDISDCLLIPALPEQIGDLSSLRDINISGCEGLDELPSSLTRLKSLEEVRCDEERSYLWKKISSEDDKIQLVEVDVLENLKDICR